MATYAQTPKIPGTKDQVTMYRNIGINLICRSRHVDVDFKKALLITSQNFANSIEKFHDGYVEEVGAQLSQEQLIKSAELQLVEGAIAFCPEKVPVKAQKAFEKIQKQHKIK